MALSGLTTVAGVALGPISCGTNVCKFAFLLFLVSSGRRKKWGNRLRLSKWVAFHAAVFRDINTLWGE